MSRRPASSLIELLIVMSACSAILTLCAGLLHRAMHVQSRARSDCDAERNATRLSQQFRLDVHRALAHRTVGADFGEDVFLELTLPDNAVLRYAVVGSAVSRKLLQDGDIVAREEYSFPSSINVGVHHEDRPNRLTLTILAQSIAADGPNKQSLPHVSSPISLHAVAVMGRDLRFTRKPDREEGSP
jgi:hypothetical protein